MPKDVPVSIEEVKQEMEDICISSVSTVMQHLANSFGDHFEDDADINQEFLKIMSTIVGEIIGGFPQDQQDRVAEESFAHIHYCWDIARTENAAEENENGEKPAAKSVDLARMKIMGNC